MALQGGCRRVRGPPARWSCGEMLWACLFVRRDLRCSWRVASLRRPPPHLEAKALRRACVRTCTHSHRLKAGAPFAVEAGAPLLLKREYCSLGKQMGLESTVRWASKWVSKVESERLGRVNSWCKRQRCNACYLQQQGVGVVSGWAVEASMGWEGGALLVRALPQPRLLSGTAALAPAF